MLHRGSAFWAIPYIIHKCFRLFKNIVQQKIQFASTFVLSVQCPQSLKETASRSCRFCSVTQQPIRILQNDELWWSTAQHMAFARFNCRRYQAYVKPVGLCCKERQHSSATLFFNVMIPADEKTRSCSRKLYIINVKASDSSFRVNCDLFLDHSAILSLDCCCLSANLRSSIIIKLTITNDICHKTTLCQ